MGKHVFLKTVEIGGVAVTLRSLNGATWSTDLKDLERFESERREFCASLKQSFETIGVGGRSKTSRRARGFNRYVRNSSRVR